ncbi:MAG: hypothetical protein JEZ07_10745 [Phycisphaerae bacterium]|nr:hypothetical protein [Phycisphaerae bacterium]
MINIWKKFVFIGVLFLCFGLASTSLAEIGRARYDYWLNISGTAVADLTGNANYPDNPTGTNIYTNMTGPRQFGENYGARLSAFLIPPVTGEYTFWIASDDAGELWLSTDDNPANVRKIAEVLTSCENNDFDALPEQVSDPITLQAGRIYYIMGLVKEATGEDHISIAWAYPDQERLIIGGDAIADSNPKLASNPSPADKATGVALEGTTLSWDSPVEGFVVTPAYDVYIGETAETQTTKLLDNSTDTSVAAGSLEFETSYFWRVDVHDPNDGTPVVRTGTVWQFNSVVPKPEITTQPQSAWVDSGGDITLTLEAQAPVVEYPITGFAWFDAADPNNSIATTQNLDLTNVTTDGAFYCEVTNAKGTTTSDTATITIKRTLAHWPFENNLNDIAGSHNGTGIGATAPTFAAGIVGQAVQLNGTDQFVEVPFAAELNPADSFSVSAWANIASTSVGRYRAVVSNRDDAPQRGFILYAQDSNSWAYWTGPGWSNLTGTAVATDAWTLLAITFDADTIVSPTTVIGTKRLYVNGEVVATATGITMDTNTVQAFQIGAGANESTTGHDFFVEGLIDEVKFYNYTLSDKEIAQLYIDVYPDAVICAGNPAFDLNGDCQVNIEDLQLLMLSWLDCNLLPDCQ